MKQDINTNPKLKKGDRVVCIIMGDETSVMFGNVGTVES